MSRTPEQQRAYRTTRPHKAAEYQRSYTQRHPDRVKASAKKRYHKIQSMLQEAKDVPCMDCSQRYPFFVMDFDHRPGEKKEFEVGQRGVSDARLRAEMGKCDVVCSNCHRIRTYHRMKKFLDGTQPAKLIVCPKCTRGLMFPLNKGDGTPEMVNYCYTCGFRGEGWTYVIAECPVCE